MRLRWALFAWGCSLALALGGGVICRTVAAAETSTAASLPPEQLEFFEARIRPLLVAQCYTCHSAKAEKLKGDLLLDSREGVLKGGATGPVLTAGDPDHSRLIEAVRWSNKDLRMPPKQRLTDAQVADLAAWVKMGAPDPRVGPVRPPAIDYAAARASWAFAPPRDHPVPSVKDAGWCKSPIDHFVLARLEEKGLKPAPPADRRTLIRRAYFDLIGLPPPSQDVDAFVHDDSPDAFAHVIDRLLASPEYGERWARHWLDVVRYTDSFDARGLGGEGDCVYAWRYRDWVVRALNQDMPYDQFVMNQVAGDLLPAAQPGAFNADGLIATCMYVLGNWPGGDADRRKMMTDMADDQVDATSRAFLGVTLACARCHDHKFDPFTQADYYSMAGIFLSTHFLPNPGSPASGVGMIRIPLAAPAELERRRQYEAHLAELQKQIDQFADSQYVAQARAALPTCDRYLAGVWTYERRHAQDPTVSPAGVAGDEHLDPYLLVRWIEYVGPMLRQQPTRKLLTRAIHGAGGLSGVNAWQSPDGRACPNVIANPTDHPMSITTLTLPAHCLAMHPGESTGVAVGWTSPIAGAVQVRGRVVDGDPNCGDGIDWRIERARARGVETLASGAFPNGGSQALTAGEGGARLDAVDVRAGDLLQLTVYPKGDYSCDTTIVELQITERDGQKRVWDLAHDVVPDLLVGDKGNPHADTFGNAAVWQFFETEAESKAGGASPGSLLEKWAADVGRIDDPGESLKRAAEVRDALVALDASGAPGDQGKTPGSKLYVDLTSPTGPFWGPARKELSQIAPQVKSAIGKMSEGLAELKSNAPPPVELGQGLLEGGIPGSEFEGTHDCHLMFRGRYDRLGPIVPRGFPKLLAGDEQPHIGAASSGRLELARWLASPQNPMTAKVMVNRIWQHHFGEGIVRTPNNYGKLGVPPTHPDLLDWLARRFVEGGWSIKAMHRMMMLSSAYQQSSEADPATYRADPDNLLFGRANRRRLEAEPLRDALLAVSGTLDASMGGPAFRDLNVPRRTLYLMTVRSDRSNYRMLFDAADPSAVIDQRIDSTVAPQALFLMNDPFVLDKVNRLAARVAHEPIAGTAARIEWLYRLLYGRPPAAEELHVGMDAVGQADPSNEASWQQYCQVLLCANEFVYVD